jgi:diguanylate cyclase (GGDEF)-like protein
VGAWLADSWNLPELYGTEIRASHDPQVAESSEELHSVLECVSLSSWLAETWLDESASLDYLKSRSSIQMIRETERSELEAAAGIMHETLPDFSALFEIGLRDSEQVENLLLEARDQLAAISLEQVERERQIELQRERLVRTDTDTQDTSFRDPVTGVYNRAYYDEHLLDQFVREAALGRASSVVFVDIDQFNEFNQTYGYDTGNEILKRTAGKILEHSREADRIVRFGGDEFVVVLWETDAETTQSIAAKMVEMEEISTATEAGGTVSITISVGTATHDEETRFSCLDSLCHAADSARNGDAEKPGNVI